MRVETDYFSRLVILFSNDPKEKFFFLLYAQGKNYPYTEGRGDWADHFYVAWPKTVDAVRLELLADWEKFINS